MIRIIGIIAFSFLLVNCDGKSEEELDCSTIESANGIELVSPLSGTFNKGDKVNVQWKVDGSKIQKVDLQVSTNGENGPFRNILEKSMSVIDTAVKCMDTIWTVGDEATDPGYNTASGTSVILRVADYSSSLTNSKSGTITVNK